MVDKKYILDIEGYFRSETRDQFPESSGIYFVYRGILHTETQPPTVFLTELLSIGEAENIRKHLADETIRSRFVQNLQYGEQVFYTYATTDVDKESRQRIVSALRYETLPTLDRGDSMSFPYEETTILIEGDRHAFIPETISAPSYL